MKWLCLVALVCACDSDDAGSGVRTAPAGEPFKTLAQWHLFDDALHQVPAEGVVPFVVTSPLFSDYAAKHRFLWLPAGETIGYRDDAVWDLPVGAILVKTFAYPRDLRDASKGERLLETRLMVHYADGWVPLTYVWDATQTTAVRKVAGAFIEASWVDLDGATVDHRYVVPTASECRQCHGETPLTHPLGVKSAQVDHDGQLERMTAQGYFASLPTVTAEHFAAPESDASVSLRARSYLDANCAHCHSSEGDASSKGLYLDFADTDLTKSATNWGVCKIPTSAGGSTCGYTYDVVPTDAAHSIMMCRMLSTTSADQMPPIGRSLVHDEGAALLAQWIDAMDPAACSPAR